MNHKTPNTKPSHLASARLVRAVTVCAAVLAAATTANAGSRRFAYSYETTTMPAKAMELESWVTWKTQLPSDDEFERFDIRHEFEFGVTDRLQLAFYFLNWRYEKSSGDDGETTFHDVAVEAIYNLTNPNTCPFGTAIYGEIKGSGDFIELESKFLLQKNYGAWMFVYNIGGAIEWEHDYDDDEAELFQSLGVAYQLNPSWSVGTEVLHEIAVPDVDTLGDSAVYAGPNASWRNDRFALTTTAMWQLTHLDDEPDFQLRTIFSIDF